MHFYMQCYPGLVAAARTTSIANALGKRVGRAGRGRTMKARFIGTDAEHELLYNNTLLHG